MDKFEYCGALIRQAREDMGLTQLELADEMEMDVRTLQRLEDGKSNPSFDRIVNLVAFLHISPDLLFFGKLEEESVVLDRIYRQLQKYSVEQIELLFKTTLHFKKWTEAHGDYKTLDEYYAILDSIKDEATAKE